MIIADKYNIPVVDFSWRIGSCISWRSLLSSAIGRIANRERIPRAIRWAGGGCNGRRFIGRYRLMFAHLMLHGFSRLAAVRYYFIMLIVMLLCRLMVIVHISEIIDRYNPITVTTLSFYIIKLFAAGCSMFINLALNMRWWWNN